MNHKAIDAGATAFVQVEVPEAWKTAEDAPKASGIEGRPETVSLVENIMFPVGRMDGDCLPVSAFVGYEDGQFPLGAAAYREARRGRVGARVGRPTQCIQCNQCAYRVPARHHSSLRADRRGGWRRPRLRPSMFPSRARVGADMQYVLAVSPARLHGVRPVRHPAARPTRSL